MASIDCILEFPKINLNVYFNTTLQIQIRVLANRPSFQSGVSFIEEMFHNFNDYYVGNPKYTQESIDDRVQGYEPESGP